MSYFTEVSESINKHRIENGKYPSLIKMSKRFNDLVFDEFNRGKPHQRRRPNLETIMGIPVQVVRGRFLDRHRALDCEFWFRH
jgi:hypothetical protein